jgi:uncharacterized membrane protein HdeD (DUF308 family)
MVRSKKWWLISIKALILIFLGAYIFKFPVSGMLGLIVFGGICLFLSGIILALFAITTRRFHKEWEWQMFEGFLDMIIAIILLSNIGLTAVTLPYVFALYGILTGIFWIIQAGYYKKKRYPFWPVALIAGLLSLVIGAMILYHPFLVTLSILAIIGIMFMIHGFFLLLFSFEISKVKKINQ